MAEECVKCEQRAVVGVLDKNIDEKSTGGGNKYRRYCLHCEAWRKMCSEERFRRFGQKFVLPLGTKSKAAPEALVRLSDYDYDDELEELLEDAGVEPAHASTDGGQREREHDRDLEAVDDDRDETAGQAVNQFCCPSCGTEQTGYPDACSECNATYNWGE